LYTIPAKVSWFDQDYLLRDRVNFSSEVVSCSNMHKGIRFWFAKGRGSSSKTCYKSFRFSLFEM
jgi:hypothetical protein